MTFLKKHTSKDITVAQSLESVSEALMDFLLDYEEDIHLLLDFCQLKKVDKKVFDVLISFARVETPKLHTVIALSSGEGQDMQSSDYRDGIKTLVGSEIRVNGFTEYEVEVYMEDIKESVNFVHVKSICGTNPLLLSLYKTEVKSSPTSAIQGIAADAVDEQVRLYMKSNLKFGNNTSAIIDGREFFYYASASVELKQEESDRYYMTWLHHHNIMILENNKLRANFPTLLELLDNVLREKLQNEPDITKVRKKQPILNGFMFEAEFFYQAKGQIDVVYKNDSQENARNVSFHVCHVKDCMSDLKELDIGVLYALRSSHPTIDGVGLLNQKDQDDLWLVFVQVSLEDYSKHSKISGLFSKPQRSKPELSKKLPTYFSYYMSLAVNCKKIILIYVSCQNSKTTLDQLQKVYGKISVKDKERIYIGAVSENSAFYKQYIFTQQSQYH